MIHKLRLSKKTLFIINMFVLIFSLYSIGVLIWYITMLILSTTNLIKDSVNIASTLLSSNQYYEPFFFVAIIMNFIVIFLSILLAFYHLLISKSVKKRYWLLFFSFIGGQIILVLINVFSSEKKRELKFFKKPTIRKATTLSFGVFLSSIVIVPISIFPLSYRRSIDDPTESFKNVTFSLDPNTPNVIEIFSDGLDPEMLTNTLNGSDKKAMSDFVVYRKFVTPSFTTSGSFSRIASSYDINDFWIGYENKFNQLSSNAKKYLINPLNTSPTYKYLSTWSGDGKTFEEKHKDFNVLNWSQARNIGIENGKRLSPQAAPYYAYSENMKQGSPSYSVILDHMLHGPIVTNKNGGPTSIYSTKKVAYRKLIDSYESLVSKLKSMVDKKTGISAYQNTLIVIWGDHSNHENLYPSFGEMGSSRKNVSSLMIKPINTQKVSQNDLVFDDSREIYAPFTERIIEEGIKSKSKIIDFINTNKNFNPGRTFATSHGYNKGVWITKFKGSMLHPDMKVGKNGWLDGHMSDQFVQDYLSKNILWKVI